MPALPSTPTNFLVQAYNGTIAITWDNIPGATAYSLQRSLDGVNFSTLATIPITGLSPANTYTDSAVTLGVPYWYQVATVSGATTGSYTAPISAVPTTTGEMSLGAIRLAAQQRADYVNKNFVTTQEWNSYINQAMFELYDLLITVSEDYFLAPSAAWIFNGLQYSYPIPNGVLTFLDDNNNSFVAAPFYKMVGVDLALNNAPNAWVTVNKFNFIDRNRFVYPNTASTIYGVFNLQYRVEGNNILFIPTPSGGQKIRIWYIPRLNQLMKDTDVTTVGISGWLEYVIVRAAKFALDKEESDSSKLTEELMYLKQRIEETATNRDNRPDTISDTRQGNWSDGWSGGRNGATGGW